MLKDKEGIWAGSVGLCQSQIGLCVSFFCCGQQPTAAQRLEGRQTSSLSSGYFDAEFLKDFQTLALISSKKETLYIVTCDLRSFW